MRLKTDYFCSGRIERYTEDGKHWREAMPQELYDLTKKDPEHLVFFGRGEPQPASAFEDTCLPGGYPYLAGIAALLPVYVEVVCVGAES